MRVQASAGVVVVRFGKRFASQEAERLDQVVATCDPMSQLTLDFTDVREFHDAAFVPLAKTLGALSATKILAHGLTRHHSRLLKYFGVGLCSARPAVHA